VVEDRLGFMERALEKLEGLGFETKPPWPMQPRFTAHAPMASEALVMLGHGAEVERWIEGYNRRHEYDPVPPPRAPISAVDWQSALGDYARIRDWVQLFSEEIDRRGWRETVSTWVPRLVPGILAALMHGVIRTAHALRTVASSPQPSRRALSELASGLAYWAARYRQPKLLTAFPGDPADPRCAAQVGEALSDLIAAHARRFVLKGERGMIPLVHSMTGPAALRLVLPHLPPETHVDAYDAARAASAVIMWGFAPKLGRPRKIAPTRSLAELIDQAAAHGDEHVIKLTEAMKREHEVEPRGILLAAAEHALETVPHRT
jgi:hypothetical protein